MSVEITAKYTYDTTKIYFQGILHLAIVRRDFVGMQTWKSSAVYSIEITFKDGAAILTEYDDRAKWAKVIELLEAELTL